MHEEIRVDIARDPPGDWRIIHLGDYVDRGPQSKEVLDFLIARTAADPRIIALRGNHDQGMLDFLQDPDPFGLFIQNGGPETMRSYGVEPGFDNDDVFVRSARLFAAAVPAVHSRFLAETSFCTSFGDYYFCHAGVDPRHPLEKQMPANLMWIRERFLNWQGMFEKVVVHGHTPASEVDFRPNRVNVDTGVYLREKLCALRLDGRDKSVMTVPA